MTTQERMLTSLNNYYDDLQLGDRFTTRARTVTETDLVAFSGLSGDYAALHTDEEFARSGPFGGRIAHGCLTLSLATGLEFSLIGSEELKIVAFYGMDRVRFVKPVFIGDTIHLEGEVTALEEKDETRGVVTFHQEIKNQRGDTVAVLDKRTLNKKRAADQ
jgi:3-hydroxybutyryl-CoA dehydratase